MWYFPLEDSLFQNTENVYLYRYFTVASWFGNSSFLRIKQFIFASNTVALKTACSHSDWRRHTRPRRTWTSGACTPRSGRRRPRGARCGACCWPPGWRCSRDWTRARAATDRADSRGDCSMGRGKLVSWTRPLKECLLVRVRAKVSECKIRTSGKLALIPVKSILILLVYPEKKKTRNFAT